MVLFGALCHSMGPQDGCGTVTFDCCCRKPKDEEEGVEVKDEKIEQEVADVEG